MAGTAANIGAVPTGGTTVPERRTEMMNDVYFHLTQSVLKEGQNQQLSSRPVRRRRRW